MSEEKLFNPSTVYIKDRKEISVSGTKSILELSDDFAALDTDLGKLIIEGSEIKLESFQKEERTVYISGNIESIYYQKTKISSSLFSKFR